MSQKTIHWAAIAMMIMLFAMIAFVTNLCSPMATIVRNECGASEFATQIGFFANYYAYAVMGIPSSILIMMYGYKRTAMIALVVGLLGLSMTFVSGLFSDYWFYLIGAFICGMSMCMLNSVVNPMLNMLGGGGKGGNRLLQAGNAFNSAAAVAVYMLVGTFVADLSKARLADATPILVVAAIVFLFVVVALFFTHLPEPPRTGLEQGQFSGALRHRHFTLGAVAIFFYMGLEMGVATFLQTFLTDDKGFSESLAIQIVAGYWFMMLVGRAIGGVVGGFINSRWMVTVASVLAIGLIMVGIYLPAGSETMVPAFDWAELSITKTVVPTRVVALLAVGIGAAIMWGGIFNLAVEGLGRYTAAASGIFMTMVSGCAILLGIQGVIASEVSTKASFYVPLFCAVYILFYALWGSRVKVYNPRREPAYMAKRRSVR